MQDINSAERYTQFTQAVLEAAEREASALIKGAEKEKADILSRVASNIEQDEIQRITAKSEHVRRQLSANASMTLRRNLLQYRESLCTKLMDKIREKCLAFAQTEAYREYLNKQLKTHMQALCVEGAYVLVKPEDVILTESLCKPFGSILVKADDNIALGGIRICAQHKIYDETLDTKLTDEQESFLSYCGLKVV